MSALVELLGVYAPGHAIEHGGKTFTFRRIDQQMKAALTVAYFKRAREAVYAVKGELESDEYDQQLKSVLDSYRRGEFNFPGGETMGYYFRAGMTELVAHLTGCKEAEAYDLLASCAVEVLHVCLCCSWESMGAEEKKKLLSLENTPGMRPLVELLSARTNGNGSPSGSSTAPPGSSAPASPARASPSATSPA